MGDVLIKSFDYNDSDLLIVGNTLPSNRKYYKGYKFDVFCLNGHLDSKIGLLETVPKKTEYSILRNQKNSESLIFTGPKIFAGR
jgi:hypothetical protein